MVAKFIIDAYHLPVPDLILSIVTDGAIIKTEKEEEIKRAIQRGLVATAKITSE